MQSQRWMPSASSRGGSPRLQQYFDHHNRHSEMLRMDLSAGASENKDIEGYSAATDRATRLTGNCSVFRENSPISPG
jgi:hypothetical protein